jgi:phage tail protein X
VETGHTGGITEVILEKSVATIAGQQGEGTIITFQDVTQVTLQTVMIKYS